MGGRRGGGEGRGGRGERRGGAPRRKGKGSGGRGRGGGISPPLSLGEAHYGGDTGLVGEPGGTLRGSGGEGLGSLGGEIRRGERRGGLGGRGSRIGLRYGECGKGVGIWRLWKRNAL